MKNAALTETWRLQDEAMRQQRMQRKDQLKMDLEAETFTKLQVDVTQRMQRLHLAREAKVDIVKYINNIQKSKHTIFNLSSWMICR